MTEGFDQSLVESDAARVAGMALREDGPRDITSQVCLTDRQEGGASLVAREALVLGGTAYATAVAEWCALPPIEWHATDGDSIAEGATIGRVSGNLARLLRAERPLLNLLQRASGIATVTARCVEQLEGTSCRLLHTRKTTPGLRVFEVLAVLAGGGTMHRIGLANTVMVKDNHWVALTAGGESLAAALDRARSEGVTDLQVEVESVEQLEEAFAAGATRLLIDNQTVETVTDWVVRARRLSESIECEATGGISFATVGGYARSGVDFISLGALTHSVQSADISLEARS